MRIEVVDVETSLLKGGEFPQTKFWGLSWGDDYLRFETTQQLWDFLSEAEPCRLYHHADYEIKQLLIDGMPIEIGFVRGSEVLSSKSHGKHEWINSYALFPSRLADILESCGFVKPGLDDLDARNIADTKDAKKAFLRIADEYHAIWGVHPIEEGRLTASGMAFTSAERYAGLLPTDLTDRAAYTGGRTEALMLGELGTADLYDINSSYPASFLEAPARDALYEVDVEVETDGPSPCWQRRAPPRSGEGPKLLFPVGRFRTWLWASTYERYIQPHGRIKALRVKRARTINLSWLSEVSGLVKSAFTERAKAKKEGNAVKAYAVKIGLNSIYGRLGLRETREIAVVSDRIPSEGVDGRIDYYRLPGGKFISFKEVKGKPRANYPFAAFVTDNARGRLYDALERSGRAYYCDTDSIYVPAGSSPDLDCGNGLGQWKYEGADSLSIVGAKDYTFGSKIVLKGGKGGYVHTIKRVLAGQTVLEQKKERLSTYNKRRVLANGETRPWKFLDW